MTYSIPARVISYLSRSGDVIKGHEYIKYIKYKKLSIILQRRGYTASRMVSLSLSREKASRDMSHDLLYGSSHDLDLRSNFQFHLSRSKSTCFDAS